MGHLVLCHEECAWQRCDVNFPTHLTLMVQGGNITYKTSGVTAALSLFQSNGTYDNQTITNFQPINPLYPVFAIARDLGSIQATQDPVVWSIGFVMDPAINYTDPSGAPRPRRLFFKTQYSDDTSLVSIVWVFTIE